MTDSQRDAIVTEARHYVGTIGIWVQAEQALRDCHVAVGYEAWATTGAVVRDIWVQAEQALRDCHVADGYEAWPTTSAVVRDAMAEHVLAELALIWEVCP